MTEVEPIREPTTTTERYVCGFCEGPLLLLSWSHKSHSGDHGADSVVCEDCDAEGIVQYHVDSEPTLYGELLESE